MTSAASIPIALEQEAEGKPERRRRTGRFLRNPSGLFGLAIILVFVIATVIAAFWTPIRSIYRFAESPGGAGPQLPGGHPMGTD